LVLDQPWIIAGKRADPIQGSNVFLAACQRPIPPQGQRDGRFTLEPWENASCGRLENGHIRHSFQDANYHDQIVKERNKPTPQHRSAARPARDLSWTEVHSGPGAHGQSSCRNGPQPMASATSHQAGTDLKQEEIGRKTPRKLADGAGAVKHLEK